MRNSVGHNELDAAVAALVATMRPCAECDTSFAPGSNPDSPFCSQDCYNAHYTHTCEACDKSYFETTTDGYCFDCHQRGFVPQDKTANFLPKHKGDKVDVKDKIQEARKPKMRTVEQYLCDQCDKVIDKPENGFVIHGNIYVADPSCNGGLIGNNFPPLKEGELTSIDKIKQTVMCKPCFLKAIGVATTNVRDAAVDMGLEIQDIKGLEMRDIAGAHPTRRASSVSPYDAGARRTPHANDYSAARVSER